ncbi:hypothetical protein ACKF11_13640 [Methylobacillus sp. Pita2]|uniref:hypothetical protein n=1 Tax=Methylobacillus sp. Pita2 TaxID=3383245 RepID=UPI0038B5FF3B
MSAAKVVKSSFYTDPEFLLPTGMLGPKWWVRYSISIFLVIAAVLVVNQGMPMSFIAVGLVLIAATQVKELFFVAALSFTTILYIAASFSHSILFISIAGAVLFIATVSLRSKIQADIAVIKTIPAMWAELRAYRDIANQPVIKFGRKAIIKYWLTDPSAKRFSIDNRGDIGRQLMSEVIRVAKDSNSFLENRKSLAWAVNELSMMLVLVMQPEPKADKSKLRGSPGISGNMSQNLVDLTQSHAALRSWVAENDLKTYQEVHEAIILRYIVTTALANTFNYIRGAVGDTVPRTEADWYHIFLYTQCALWESEYRRSLGMPLELTEESLEEMREVVHAVVNGVKPPIIV